MTYEVELKFRLPDPALVLRKLRQWNAQVGDEETQADQYFAHPSRDFATTNEALRIRSIGDVNRITYKGPVIDQATKTRHESELLFESGPDAAEQLAQIWEKLGFRRVRVVRKVRQTFHLIWAGRSLQVCFDKLEGLGDFLEIETLAETEDKLDAQQAILAFARELHLGESERRSYLEMLIQQDGDGNSLLLFS